MPSRCSRCTRPLTAPESISRGMGKSCFERGGPSGSGIQSVGPSSAFAAMPSHEAPAVGDPDLDALLDAAAARAQEDCDESLVASLPERFQAAARLALGGDHMARWGFEARWEDLGTPEDLDELDRLLPGLGLAPRPSTRAGEVSGIKIGPSPTPDPLDEDVVASLRPEDLAVYRAGGRHESQSVWSAINGLKVKWSSAWTDENREARREFTRRLVVHFLSFFDMLFRSQPRINPAIAG